MLCTLKTTAFAYNQVTVFEQDRKETSETSKQNSKSENDISQEQSEEEIIELDEIADFVDYFNYPFLVSEDFCSFNKFFGEYKIYQELYIEFTTPPPQNII